MFASSGLVVPVRPFPPVLVHEETGAVREAYCDLLHRINLVIGITFEVTHLNFSFAFDAANNWCTRVAAWSELICGRANCSGGATVFASVDLGPPVRPNGVRSVKVGWTKVDTGRRLPSVETIGPATDEACAVGLNDLCRGEEDWPADASWTIRCEGMVRRDVERILCADEATPKTVNVENLVRRNRFRSAPDEPRERKQHDWENPQIVAA